MQSLNRDFEVFSAFKRQKLIGNSKKAVSVTRESVGVEFPAENLVQTRKINLHSNAWP